jgi:hypothetical protein
VALNKKCTYLAAADDSGETKVCWSFMFQENISGNQSTTEFYINYAFHAMNLTVSLLNATGSKGFSTNTIRHERGLPILLRVSTLVCCLRMLPCFIEYYFNILLFIWKVQGLSMYTWFTIYNISHLGDFVGCIQIIDLRTHKVFKTLQGTHSNVIHLISFIFYRSFCAVCDMCTSWFVWKKLFHLCLRLNCYKKNG